MTEEQKKKIEEQGFVEIPDPTMLTGYYIVPVAGGLLGSFARDNLKRLYESALWGLEHNDSKWKTRGVGAEGYWWWVEVADKPRPNKLHV